MSLKLAKQGVNNDRMAFNLGRPALFAGEETIRNAREFLKHPLAVRNDSRLVAACELLSGRGGCELVNHVAIAASYRLSGLVSSSPLPVRWHSLITSRAASALRHHPQCVDHPRPGQEAG